MVGRLPFQEAWCVDFEYHQPDGSLPDPLCVTALEIKSGRRVEHWLDPASPIPCPYSTGPDAVLIAHNSSAEVLCHRVLEWARPTYVLDTLPEYRAIRNDGSGIDDRLLPIAHRYGIPTVCDAAKEEGRKIAMKGRANAEQHKSELIEYCWTDVDTTAELLQAMLPQILDPKNGGLAHALIRGSYMAALSAVEFHGMPWDCQLFEQVSNLRSQIRHMLIAEVDTGKTDCYVDGQFKRKQFAALLDRLGLLQAWPRTATGILSLKDDVFEEWAGHPVLEPFRELYVTLQKLQKFDLNVGADGRHRAKKLAPFGTKTGRNAPKGSVFMPAPWFRSFLKSTAGWCLVYSDYSAQEVHIAARKSGDPAMIAAVESGDPYLWFGKATGLVPPDATKSSHKMFRDIVLKRFMLSVSYGAEAPTVARQTGTTVEYASRQLLAAHRRVFPRYWAWTESAVYAAAAERHVLTAMGWPLRITRETEYRSLLNHRIQAAGADILRMAVIGLDAQDVRLCMPVHDAVLWECREEELQHMLAVVERVMREAAALVLGHEIPVDHKVTSWPDRYVDGRGQDMWDRVVRYVEQLTQPVSEIVDNSDFTPWCGTSTIEEICHIQAD